MSQAVIAPEHWCDIRGKSYPKYAGALDAAHQAGLKSLTTEIVQVPVPENGHTAIVMARAEFEDGRVFEDVGDASPVNTDIKHALLRIASTRAKGRVLRDAVNIGTALAEEIGGDDERDDRMEARTHRAPERTPTVVTVDPRCYTPECRRALTKGQYEVSVRAYGHPYCPSCQKERARVAA